MQLNFTVHSIAPDPQQVTLEMDGAPVEATVTGAVVELVSADGRSTLTLRIPPKDLAEVQADYEVGDQIVATFAPAS